MKLERISVANLKEGTTERLRKKALKAGYKLINGKPDLARYLRDWMEAK